MTPELRNLIAQYQAKANDVFPRIAKALGVALPITNMDWAANVRVKDNDLTPCGLRYRKHGFGIEIDYPGGSIDIDLGDRGEYDGFDVWRLIRFANKNGQNIPYSEAKRIGAELQRAVQAGELRWTGGSFYYPAIGDS